MNVRAVSEEERLRILVDAYRDSNIALLKQLETKKEDISYKIIADTYGYENQVLQLQEEMNELGVAISKFRRIDYDKSDEAYSNLVEELADCSLVIKQITYLLCCEKQVAEIEKYKATREIQRILR